jgi:hypothetical protein
MFVNSEDAQNILANHSWIKVKKYQDDPSKTWEERYAALEKHHLDETQFLIEKNREIVAQKLKDKSL